MSFVENIKCDLCGEEHGVARTIWVILNPKVSDIRHICGKSCLLALSKVLEFLCIPFVLEPSKKPNIPSKEYAGKIMVWKVKDE